MCKLLKKTDDRQTNKHTDKQTDRQTGIQIYSVRRWSLNLRLNNASEVAFFKSSDNAFHNFGPEATILFFLMDVLTQKK